MDKRGTSEVLAICDRPTAVKYFNDNLRQLFNPDITESEKTEILQGVSNKGLKHLYMRVFGISWVGGCTKMAILERINNFCRDEERTRDLTKFLNF